GPARQIRPAEQRKQVPLLFPRSQTLSGRVRSMKYCRKCILPDTRPGLRIGPDGVCSACEGHREKCQVIDWDARRGAFEAVVAHARARSHGYDCIIPVSGGKDSTWQV